MAILRSEIIAKKCEHFKIYFRMSCFRTVPQNSWPAMQMNITRYDFISWLLWVLIIMTIVVIWIILSLSSCKTELCKMRLSVMIIYFDQHNYHDYHVDDLHVKLRWIECKMSSSLELLSSIVSRWYWRLWWLIIIIVRSGNLAVAKSWSDRPVLQWVLLVEKQKKRKGNYRSRSWYRLRMRVVQKMRNMVL